MRMLLNVFSAAETQQEFTNKQGVKEKVKFFEITGMDSDFEKPVPVSVRIYNSYESLQGQVKRGDDVQVRNILSVRDPNKWNRTATVTVNAGDIKLGESLAENGTSQKMAVAQ